MWMVGMVFRNDLCTEQYKLILGAVISLARDQGKAQKNYGRLAVPVINARIYGGS